MEENKKLVTVEQMIMISDSVNALFEEHLKYPINVAYKLHKLRDELESMSKYVIERVFDLIPKMKEQDVELDENEKLVYQAILNSPIEIDTFGLKKDDIYMYGKNENNEMPIVELQIIDNLALIF